MQVREAPKGVEKVNSQGKYSDIQRTVKEGLMIILVEADYILEEQELTELSEIRLKEIKRQTERIAKSITKIVQEPKEIKAFLSALRQQNNGITNELARILRIIGKIRTAQSDIEALTLEFEKKIK